jgi:tRNA A-37 threonylcarbamoyl transferase component Bud32
VRNTLHPDRDGAAALADSGLPQLARAADPATLAPRLAAACGDHGRFTVRLLKHVPRKRAVLAIEFGDGTRVIAKLYRKDRAAHHAASLAQLGTVLEGGGTRAPRLLACWEDLGAVLQEWVPGEPVPDFEHLGAEVRLVERLGAALGELHAAEISGLTHTGLAAHVRRTCRTGLESLGADWPQMAAVAHELEGAIYARDACLAHALRPSHGDYAPRQLFTDAAHVYLVDLDGLALSDPALDVANFRVGLEAHLGDAGKELGDRFLGTYLERRGIGALPGLTHYEAFCDLRRALIVWRKRPPNWEADLRRSLERGRARL